MHYHPTPWTTAHGGDILDATGAQVLNDGEMRDEAADHIVACVNACAGIEDPETFIPRLRALLDRAEESLADLCARLVPEDE